MLSNNDCFSCLNNQSTFCQLNNKTECCSPTNLTSEVCSKGQCFSSYSGPSFASQDLKYNTSHARASPYDNYLNLLQRRDNTSNPCGSQTPNLTLPSIGYLFNTQVYDA